MGNTTIASLTYPELNDGPNVPRDLQELAEDVDRELYRPFPCLSTARPANSPVPLRLGFTIRETDTGDVHMWTGTGYKFLYNTSDGSSGGIGGGGGGAGGAAGAWHSGTTQSVGTSNTILSWPTEDTAPGSAITRSTQSAGHKFTLNEAGLYAISANVYFPVGSAGQRYLQIMDVAGTISYDAMVQYVPTASNNAVINKLALTKRFTAGTALAIMGAQSGQTTLTVQSLRLDIAKVAA